MLTGLFIQRGNTRRAEAVHAEVEARAIMSRISFFTRAMSALYLGRIDDALEQLERQGAKLRLRQRAFQLALDELKDYYQSMVWADA